MIELNSSNYACARSNSAKKMTQCHFDVDYDRLSSDIQRLEELLQENQLDSGDKRIVSEAIWVLKKWLEKPTVQICFNFNEVNELENNADETVIDGIKYIKRVLAAEETSIEDRFKYCSDAMRIAGNTGLMNVKYLKTDGYIVLIDLSSVIDALAFEYNSADETDRHTIDVWTKEATLFTVNDGKIIREMVKGENGTISGQHTDCVRELRINSMCPKTKIGGKSIVSYMGANVPIAKLGTTTYKGVIDACAREITACVLGKVASSELGAKLKWLGLTNNCEYAIEFKGDNLEELLLEFSIIAKVMMKKYRFEPDIYLYNRASDRFVKC